MNQDRRWPWLLLAHQLPPKPAYFRVKIWRRLQAIGAVSLKNAVYALPATERGQEDFAWLVTEIVEGGGEAMLCEARMSGGLSDAEVQDLFRAARDADYDALAVDARALIDVLEDGRAERPTDLEAQVRRLKHRRDQIAALDFFGAERRKVVEGLLAQVEAAGRGREDAGSESGAKGKLVALAANATWVTRAGVRIDRIASAWLIRRFIDPQARFKFVPPEGYRPQAGEVRFDMFEAEFTHEGDRCTFEVLLARSGWADPALASLGEIVHDLDLTDAKYGRPEAAGIAALVAGICASTTDDGERVTRGAALFDDLYEFFRSRNG